MHSSVVTEGSFISLSRQRFENNAPSNSFIESKSGIRDSMRTRESAPA